MGLTQTCGTGFSQHVTNASDLIPCIVNGKILTNIIFSTSKGSLQVQMALFGKYTDEITFKKVSGLRPDAEKAVQMLRQALAGIQIGSDTVKISNEVYENFAHLANMGYHAQALVTAATKDGVQAQMSLLNEDPLSAERGHLRTGLDKAIPLFQNGVRSIENGGDAEKVLPVFRSIAGVGFSAVIGDFVSRLTTSAWVFER